MLWDLILKASSNEEVFLKPISVLFRGRGKGARYRERFITET